MQYRDGLPADDDGVTGANDAGVHGVEFMSARHAGPARAGRRSFLLLSGATVLGVWFGLRAPDVTPVAPPAAAVVQEQPTDGITGTPAVPVPRDGRAQRDGGR